MLTPYQFASNNPIANIDIDGLEGQYAGWQDYHRLNTTAIKGGDVKSVAAEIDRKNKINTLIAFGTVLAPLVGVTAVETMPVWLPWAYSSAASGILATGKYGPEALGFAAGAMGFDGEIPGTSGDEFGRLVSKGLKSGASRFYAKFPGFAENPQRIVDHLRGIDFSKDVFETTIEKGTVLEQWVGKHGVGDYFTMPGEDPSKLGIDITGRTKKIFVVTEDTKVLQSTTADIEKHKGGALQYFSPEIKKAIKEEKND